jgi:hypothetical protein
MNCPCREAKAELKSRWSNPAAFLLKFQPTREGKIGINAEARKNCVNAWD